MASMLGNVIQFFDRIGIYDVVLPFLLTFTIVFAILEKTKVLGTTGTGDKKESKKNLNAMVAFVMGFLVIASAQLVQVVTQVSSQVVVLVLLIVFFLALVGVFYKPSAPNTDAVVPVGWQSFFLFFMFAGIMLIFLAAIKMDNGKSWLEVGLDYLVQYWSSTVVASIMLIVVIVATIWYVTKKEGVT